MEGMGSKGEGWGGSWDTCDMKVSGNTGKLSQDGGKRGKGESRQGGR